MNTSNGFYRNKLKIWIKLNYSEDAVRKDLIESSIPASEIKKYLDDYRNARSSKKISQGFILIGIGGFIGLIACILSMIIEHQHWNSVFLYGATTLGVLLVLYGLYQVFE